MGFLKLLLKNLGLYIILITNTVFCTDLVIIPRLPDNTIPYHYDIFLTPNLEKDNFTFYGESNVTIEILHTSLNIFLHSTELKIDETATTLIDDNGIIYKPMKHSHDNITDILSLNFENALSPGLYTLNMKFAGIISEIGEIRKGFMIFPYTNERNNNVFATYFEPSAARRMFPCWDEPALKATFDISVMHHKKHWVLSNMPIIRRQLLEHGMMWIQFKTSLYMSTYLVTIAFLPTSDYIRISNAKETINVWCRSSLKSQITFMHSIAETVTPVLIQYVNRSETVWKTDHVMIPNFPVNGMENWGLISYNELSVTYHESKYPTYKRADVAAIVTHEIIHQWFGNLVTPSWWTHLWLKEGLTVFLQTYIVNKIFEDWRTMDLFVLQTLHNCLMIDIGILNAVTLQEGFENTEELYSIEVYGKAPALMRMLHNTVTEEVFRKGLIMYLVKHEYESTVPHDLWSAIQSALYESDVRYRYYTINKVMDTWMNQDSYPEVKVMKNYTTGNITISQQCIYRGKFNKWWIPITFATQSNPDFSNTVPRYWLRPDQNKTFLIEPNDWIIVNIQQTGYYRVNYDMKNWAKISYYLNYEEFTNIHVLNRVQIMDDLFAFVMIARINGFFLVNLIRYLYREVDYVAWYPLLFRIIPLLVNLFFLPEATCVKLTIMTLLNGLTRKIGYLENIDDDHITKLTRLEAIKWACTLGDEFCKNTAATQLSRNLADPEHYKFPPGHSFMYCIGLMAANRTTWDKMLELYQKIDSKKENLKKTLLSSLSCAENSDIIINYLNIAAFNNSLFHEEEHSLIFMSILDKHSDNHLILDYILDNVETIKPKSLTITVIIRLTLAKMFSNEQIHKIKRFSDSINFDNDPKTRILIKELIEEREKKLKEASNYFKKRFY